MNATATPPHPAATTPPAGHHVTLPLGLIGFEAAKRFALLADPAGQPFAWLKAEGETSLAFVVIDPFVALPEYQPEISEADAAFLGIQSARDALLLGIVTLHAPNQATMNLKGPVVINRHSRVGKQVIISNSAEYSVQHPLPVAA